MPFESTSTLPTPDAVPTETGAAAPDAADDDDGLLWPPPYPYPAPELELLLAAVPLVLLELLLLPHPATTKPVATAMRAMLECQRFT